MRRAAPSAVLALAVVAVLVLTFVRLPYGADLQDEPMHLASAHRFANGARPYVDELMSSPQNAALLLAPAVGTYESVAGREGIVLFSRRLYFLFTIAVAAALVWGLREFIPTEAAILTSLAAVAWVPFSLPEFHQNTLAASFFAVGCVLGVAAAAGERPARARALVAGLAHGLAVFVYPFLLAPALVFAAAVWLLFPLTRRGTLVAYAAAQALPLAALAAVWLYAGLANVADAVEYAMSYLGQGGGLGKVMETARYRWESYPHKPLVALAVVALLAGHARWPSRARALALLLPLLPFAPGALDTNVGSVDYVTNVGLLGIVVAALLWREDETARRLIVGVWLPAAVAGLVVSWASSNDGQNFGIGFFAGLLVTAVLLVRAGRGSSRVLPLLALVGMLAIFLGFQYASVYRDEPVAELEARIPSGPYEGIVTTPVKKRFIVRLGRDLRRAGRADATILVYDELPLGYLLSPSSPLTNTGWALHRPGEPEYRELLLDYYERRGRLPSVIVRVRRLLIDADEQVLLRYPPDDALDRIVRSGRFELVAVAPEYAIYRRG